MAHILIHTLSFPPDNTSTAHLMADLAEDLVGAGHRVTVLTSRPHNNPDHMASAQQPMTRLAPLVRRSQYRGASVWHSWILPKTAGIGMRLCGWLIFHLISMVSGMFIRPKVDVIFAPSPPPSIGVVAWILGLRHGAPFIYNVQELYPDVAVEMDAVSSRPFLSMVQRLSDFVYAKAAVVTVISSQIEQRLLERGVSDGKVEVIPNWVDTDQIRPLDKVNEFSQQHGVHDRFVVSYAGNIGPAQSLDELLEAAALLEENDSIRFMIMGGGTHRDDLAKRLRQMSLSSTQLLPPQPYELVPQIYATADLSFVPLHPKLGGSALPSKVYRIMASGRPILALTDRDSDLARLVHQAGCGWVVQPGDSAALADVIIEASGDPQRRRVLGDAGRSYAKAHFSRRALVGRYLELVASLARVG